MNELFDASISLILIFSLALAAFGIVGGIIAIGLDMVLTRRERRARR